MKRLALLCVAILILAACSAEARVLDSADNEAAGVENVAALESPEEDAPEEEPGEAVSPASADEDTPTTTEAPTAPQPVTASTVHETQSDDFPDILAAQATPESNGAWRFDVTVSSPYDTPQRYADAWRVVGPDGTEYGIRVLTHDHASEQPFTRSQGGIEIPADVTTVTVEGRDQANGWGGGFLTVQLTP